MLFGTLVTHKLKKSATKIVYMCFFTLCYVLCEFNSSEKLLGLTYINNLWHVILAYLLQTSQRILQQKTVYLCFCLLNYVLCDLISLEKLLRFTYINKLWHVVWNTCYTVFKEKCNNNCLHVLLYT